MADLQSCIVDELRKSGPLTAKDLAKKLGKLKRDINRTMFAMDKETIVERADSSNPPRWKLRGEHAAAATAPQVQSQPGVGVVEQPLLIPAESPLTNNRPEPPQILPTSSSSSMGASVSAPDKQDEELEHQVLEVLQKSQEPLPAYTIGIKLGRRGKGDVNPTLYKLKEDGIAEVIHKTGSKPLWQLKSSHNILGNQAPNTSSAGATGMGPCGTELGPIASWNSEPLYTRKDSGDGAVTFEPLRQYKILNRVESQQPSGQQESDDSAAGTGGPNQRDVPRVPIQETSDNAQTDGEKAKKKIDPINLDDVNKIQISEDKDSMSRPSVNPDGKDEPKMEIRTMPGDAMATKTNDAKKPSKKKMAARFGNDTQTDMQKLKTSILKFLSKNKDRALTTEEVANGLGFSTRSTVHGPLVELEKEGKVQSTKVGDISHWRLRGED